MDLLMSIVIAVFIITAVFVGHHASQEPREEMAEGHGITEFDAYNNQEIQKMSISHINAIQD
jgi:hypothetical protein